MDKEMLLSQGKAELKSATDRLVSTGRFSERVIILTPEGAWKSFATGEQPPDSWSGFRPDTYIIVRQMARKAFSGGEEGKMVEEMRRGGGMMSSETNSKVMEMLAVLATSPDTSILLSQRFLREGPKLVLDSEPRITEGYMESWSEDAMESTEFKRLSQKIFDSAKENLSRDKQLLPLLLAFPHPSHSEMAIIPIQDKEDIPWIVRDMKPTAYFFVSEACALQRC